MCCFGLFVSVKHFGQPCCLYTKLDCIVLQNISNVSLYHTTLQILAFITQLCEC